MVLWVGVGLIFAAVGLITAWSKSAIGTHAIAVLLSFVGGGAVGTKSVSLFELRPELAIDVPAALCSVGAGFIIGLVGGVYLKGHLLDRFKYLRDKNARGLIGAVFGKRLRKNEGALRPNDKDETGKASGD